jgi:leader peptidase (prepilin peptidase)/N-methyltransferase
VSGVAMLVGMGAFLAIWAITSRPAWWGLAADVRVVPALRWATAAMGGGLAGVAVAAGEGGALAAALAAGALAAGADAASREIPHRWVAVMVAAGLGELAQGALAWQPTLLAAFAVGTFFLLAYVVTRGGIGLGDVKLAFGFALALGWPRAMTAVVVGLWAGGLFALGLIVTHRARRQSTIPLGPFLIVGMAVAGLLTGPSMAS